MKRPEKNMITRELSPTNTRDLRGIGDRLLQCCCRCSNRRQLSISYDAKALAFR